MPKQMQRAMAAEAEASREARAKVSPLFDDNAPLVRVEPSEFVFQAAYKHKFVSSLLS